jgi:hypothetical protein
VFGQPDIVEIMYTPDGELYPSFSGTSAHLNPSAPDCGLWKTSDFFDTGRAAKYDWKEYPRRQPYRQRRINEEDDFLPPPNLSLNAGSKTMSKTRFRLSAALGLAIQLSYIAYATTVTFYVPSLYDMSNKPSISAYIVNMVGTCLLTAGMVYCSMLVDWVSQERHFKRTSPRGPGSTHHLIWVQPAQFVADQVFQSLGFAREVTEFITSWRSESDIRFRNIQMSAAIGFTLAGFVMQ